MLKDAVSILGISVTYMLNKALKMKKFGDSNLYAQGQPCDHKCNEGCLEIGCKDCEQRLIVLNMRKTNPTNCSRLEWSEVLLLFSNGTQRLGNLR